MKNSKNRGLKEKEERPFLRQSNGDFLIDKPGLIHYRLRQIDEEIDYLKIGTTRYKITNKKLFLIDDNFGTAVRFISYTFLTPWLARNEENHEKYQCLGSGGKRKELLEKILSGKV